MKKQTRRSFYVLLAIIFCFFLTCCQGATKEAVPAPTEEPQQTAPAAEPAAQQLPDLSSDEMYEIFEHLNGLDADAFASEYDLYTKAMEDQGLLEAWDSLCRGASAYWDLLQANEIVAAYAPEWTLFEADAADYTDYEKVVSVIGSEGFSPFLFQKIYTQGNPLDIPVILWTEENYGYASLEQIEKRKITDPIEKILSYDWLELCKNEAFCGNFFMYPIYDDAVRLLSERQIAADSEEAAFFILQHFFLPAICQPELNDEAASELLFLISESIGDEDVSLPYPCVTEPPSGEVSAARKNGQSITLMVIERGDTVGIDSYADQGLKSIYDYPTPTCLRDQNYLRGIFGEDIDNKKVSFTSIEEEADVILIITTLYEYVGQYSGGGVMASVYGAWIVIDAVLCGSGEREYLDSVQMHLSNMPGNSVSYSGNSAIWMDLPPISSQDDPYVAKFRDSIYAWFE